MGPIGALALIALALRIVKRILSDPGYLFTGLPKAIRKQPKKFVEEAKELRDPKKHPEA